MDINIILKDLNFIIDKVNHSLIEVLLFLKNLY